MAERALPISQLERRYSHTVSRCGDYIYVFGGRDQNSTFYHSHGAAVDLRRQTFKKITLPTPFTSICHTAAVVGETIFLHGGYSGAYAIRKSLVAFSTDTREAKIIEPKKDDIWPEARFGHTSSVVGRGLKWDDPTGWMLGYQSVFFGDLWTYNTVSEEWCLIETTESPPNRCYHSSVTVGDRIYIYGGQGGKKASFCDLWSFNVKTLKWTQVDVSGTPPLPRFMHTTTLLDSNRMLLLGGRDNTGPHNTIYIFHFDTEKWIEYSLVNTPDASAWAHQTLYFNELRMIIVYGGYGSHPVFCRYSEDWLVEIEDRGLEHTKAIKKVQSIKDSEERLKEELKVLKDINKTLRERIEKNRETYESKIASLEAELERQRNTLQTLHRVLKNDGPKESL